MTTTTSRGRRRERGAAIVQQARIQEAAAEYRKEGGCWWCTGHRAVGREKKRGVCCLQQTDSPKPRPQATPSAPAATTSSASTPAPAAACIRRIPCLFILFLTFYHRHGRCSFPLIFAVDIYDHNSVARSSAAFRLSITSEAGYRAVPPPVLRP